MSFGGQCGRILANIIDLFNRYLAKTSLSASPPANRTRARTIIRHLSDLEHSATPPAWDEIYAFLHQTSREIRREMKKNKEEITQNPEDDFFKRLEMACSREKMLIEPPLSPVLSPRARSLTPPPPGCLTTFTPDIRLGSNLVGTYVRPTVSFITAAAQNFAGYTSSFFYSAENTAEDLPESREPGRNHSH